MTAKEKDATKTSEDFFAPANLFKIMLGEDGHGGAIGKLYARLDETNTKVDQLIHKTIPCFERKISKYNGLHDSVTKIEADLAAQVEICKDVQEAKAVAAKLAESTTEAYRKGMEAAEKKGSDEAKETIKGTVWLIIKVLTILTLATGLISWFLGLWRW